MIEQLDVKCKVSASYYELYNEAIRDLMVDWRSDSPNKIKFEPTGNFVSGITQIEVHSSTGKTCTSLFASSYGVRRFGTSA